jgi:hypothetical protein
MEMYLSIPSGWRGAQPERAFKFEGEGAEPARKPGLHGWLDKAATVFVPNPQWPNLLNPAMGFQYTTEVSGASALSTQAFSFEDAANRQLPACASTA